MAARFVHLDLRAAVPVAALAVVVLVIIFVELCGREDVKPLAQSTPLAVATATPFTPGPTRTPGPSPTMAPEQATATREALVGGSERDLTRVQDLAGLKEALEEYRDEHGGYPNTQGNIQTLCAFTGADKGCELREVLSPLPEDPLGDPSSNGYWYASNGATYTLYAVREAEQFDECPDHPDHLKHAESLLCTTGP
jgi:hypothetical protein